MNEPIQGKIARVLNEREIAINVGTGHGVRVGMYFDVMDVHDANIKDPDTNEVLGPIERPKIRLKIIHVQEKLSVAATYRSEQVNLGGDGRDLNDALGLGPIARSLMPPKWVTRYETFEKTEESSTPFEEENSRIKTGDRVIQVVEKKEAKEEDANGE